jgi:alkylated DNA repair dioxygenase AlkB
MLQVPAFGWHKDRPEFGDIIGISLLAPCVFRLRRKIGTKWRRASIVAEPRSVYVMRGPVRRERQHSIPPLDTLRYSITFRTFRGFERATNGTQIRLNHPGHAAQVRPEPGSSP